MANASRKQMGPGSSGKGSGSGGLTPMPDDGVPPNMTLSNRDKKLHPATRGLDSRRIQTEQFQDHVANRETDG